MLSRSTRRPGVTTWALVLPRKTGPQSDVSSDAGRKLPGLATYMPLLRMTMYSKGIQLYCAPTADDRDTWLSTMQHVALEGRCFVFTACQHLRRGDCPAEYAAIQGDEPGTVIMRGGSAIISPLGRVLAGPLYEENGILTAEIDLGEIARSKYDFDVVGHYARPDVFQLHVNEKPARPVVSD